MIVLRVQTAAGKKQMDFDADGFRFLLACLIGYPRFAPHGEAYLIRDDMICALHVSKVRSLRTELRDPRPGDAPSPAASSWSL